MPIVLRPHSDSDLHLAASYFGGLSETMETARAHEGIPVAQTKQDNGDMAENMANSPATGTLLQMVSEHPSLQPLRTYGVAPPLAAMESGAHQYTKTLFDMHREIPDQAVRRFAAYQTSDEPAAITEGLGALVLR